MKYLKSIFESLDPVDDMVLVAYKNAIANWNKRLFDSVRKEYGFNDDIFLELVTYCILELKDVATLENLLNFNSDSESELELDYEEILEVVFEDSNWWNVTSGNTGIVVMSIHKNDNPNDEFKLSFTDDQYEEEGDEADFQYVSNAIHKKIKKELHIDLSTGMWINNLEIQDAVSILLLLMKEEEEDSSLVYVEGSKELKDIVKEKIHKII